MLAVTGSLCVQAALHDALGSAIQQHCCIVGQDSSDRQDSASEAGSDAYTDDSWSESESEVSGVFESLKASCCESTPKAAGERLLDAWLVSDVQKRVLGFVIQPVTCKLMSRNRKHWFVQSFATDQRKVCSTTE